MTGQVRGHIKRGISVSAIVAGAGSIIMLMQQAVDLRGKIIAQTAQQQTSAQAMGVMMKDVGRLAKDVDKIETRVSRLERAPRHTLVTQRAAVAADTVAVRSPGVVESLVLAPVRFLGAIFGRSK